LSVCPGIRLRPATLQLVLVRFVLIWAVLHVAHRIFETTCSRQTYDQHPAGGRRIQITT
jgi:hypothetical protein